MILIMDNGLHYSDHGIYFIDCDGMDPDEVSRLWCLGRRRSYGDVPHEVARAESLTWREPDTCAKPEQAIDTPWDVPEDFDVATVSDRGLAILATGGDAEVREWVAAEQIRRLA
jgi:hypothetical protein